MRVRVTIEFNTVEKYSAQEVKDAVKEVFLDEATLFCFDDCGIVISEPEVTKVETL